MFMWPSANVCPDAAFFSVICEFKEWPQRQKGLTGPVAALLLHVKALPDAQVKAVFGLEIFKMTTLYLCKGLVGFNARITLNSLQLHKLYH